MDYQPLSICTNKYFRDMIQVANGHSKDKVKTVGKDLLRNLIYDKAVIFRKMAAA